MKKILAALVTLYLMVPATYGQDDYVRPQAIGISFFLNDFVTASRIRTSSLSHVLINKQWAKIREMSPGIGITYFKGLTNHIDFAGNIGGSFISYPMPNRTFSDDKFLLEGNASVNLKMTTERYWVQPYISVGVGAHKYGSFYGAFIPFGLGLKVNFFDEAHLFILSTYRVPVTTETANYHFQHSIGIAGIIGKKKEPKIITPPPPPPPADTDGDGITDDKDKCVTVPGVAKYDGCPIPDTDKDGVNDDEDKCPTVPGLARYQGCPVPDTDKDGINDEEDKCPDEPGLARYQGCPVPDRDKDGVNDEDDKCPDVAGDAANGGCPVISKETEQKIAYAAKNIFFSSGKAVLLPKSFQPLDEVVLILNAHKELQLAIDGYTDNAGRPESNQLLSQQRADAVKKYLAVKGVDIARLNASGHGQDNPVADNKTTAGRAKNRRVQLQVKL